MIEYEHLSTVSRMWQYRGTVIEDSVVHIFNCNLITLALYLTFRVYKPDWVSNEILVNGVSPEAWKMLMLPLGFLLSLRTNQAYGRFQQGVEAYTKMVGAAGELCRQTISYVKYDDQYRNPVPGTDPKEGEEDCADPDKERIFRHVFAFLAAVRQDIRNRRTVQNPDPEMQRKKALEERLHMTQQELDYIVRNGCYNKDINTPLIVGAWLSQDVAAVADRVKIGPLIAKMDSSVGDMIEAFHHIDQITNIPVPWPYTHLTQFFTLIWVYTLPLFLVHEYGPGSFVIITFMAVILFGMDTVAREVQDPFGFDENDLNVQGYEISTIENVSVMINGPLRVRTRDFASSSTSLTRVLDQHASGAAEFMDTHELVAGTDVHENMFSLSRWPWRMHGTFHDSSLKAETRKVNKGKERIRAQEEKTAHIQNTIAQGKIARTRAIEREAADGSMIGGEDASSQVADQAQNQLV